MRCTSVEVVIFDYDVDQMKKAAPNGTALYIFKE